MWQTYRMYSTGHARANIGRRVCVSMALLFAFGTFFPVSLIRLLFKSWHYQKRIHNHIFCHYLFAYFISTSPQLEKTTASHFSPKPILIAGALQIYK